MSDPNEPDFVAQSAENHTPSAVKGWILDQKNSQRKNGITWWRVTTHPTIEHLVLLEGWKERPDVEGEPRFAVNVPEPVDPPKAPTPEPTAIAPDPVDPNPDS